MMKSLANELFAEEKKDTLETDKQTAPFLQ